MMAFPDEDYVGSNLTDSEVGVHLPLQSSNSKKVDPEGILENLTKILDFSDKLDIFESLISTSGGRAFSLGTLIFLMLMVLSIYLDSSLRSQIFYVFDNCTNDDYAFEYIVKSVV